MYILPPKKSEKTFKIYVSDEPYKCYSHKTESETKHKSACHATQLV